MFGLLMLFTTPVFTVGGSVALYKCVDYFHQHNNNKQHQHDKNMNMDDKYDNHTLRFFLSTTTQLTDTSALYKFDQTAFTAYLIQTNRIKHSDPRYKNTFQYPMVTAACACATYCIYQMKTTFEERKIMYDIQHHHCCPSDLESDVQHHTATAAMMRPSDQKRSDVQPSHSYSSHKDKNNSNYCALSSCLDINTIFFLDCLQQEQDQTTLMKLQSQPAFYYSPLWHVMRFQSELDRLLQATWNAASIAEKIVQLCCQAYENDEKSKTVALVMFERALEHWILQNLSSSSNSSPNSIRNNEI